MSSPKPTHEDVARWIAVNGRRVKNLRLLTNAEIARRVGRLSLEAGRSLDFSTSLVTRVLSDKWKGSHATHWILNALQMLVGLANALDMTPAELLSRPDDMSLLKQDQRKTAPERARKRAKLKLTQEQAEKEALLEWVGLDL